MRQNGLYIFAPYYYCSFERPSETNGYSICRTDCRAYIFKDSFTPSSYYSVGRSDEINGYYIIITNCTFLQSNVFIHRYEITRKHSIKKISYLMKIELLFWQKWYLTVTSSPSLAMYNLLNLNQMTSHIYFNNLLRIENYFPNGDTHLVISMLLLVNIKVMITIKSVKCVI